MFDALSSEMLVGVIAVWVLCVYFILRLIIAICGWIRWSRIVRVVCVARENVPMDILDPFRRTLLRTFPGLQSAYFGIVDAMRAAGTANATSFLSPRLLDILRNLQENAAHVLQDRRTETLFFSILAVVMLGSSMALTLCC